jgi:hypothetical protein
MIRVIFGYPLLIAARQDAERDAFRRVRKLAIDKSRKLIDIVQTPLMAEETRKSSGGSRPDGSRRMVRYAEARIRWISPD